MISYHHVLTSCFDHNSACMMVVNQADTMAVEEQWNPDRNSFSDIF